MATSPTYPERIAKPFIGKAAGYPLTSNDGTFTAGDIFINDNSVISNGVVGWVCVASGAPGTWEEFGVLNGSTQTIAGSKTFTDTISTTNIVASGAIRGLRSVTTQATGTNVNLTANDSGRVLANTATSGTTVYTLPSAAAGLTFTFVEAGNAGGMLKITAASGDKIIGKTDGAASASGLATNAAGSIENTAGTNVRGDFCTLVAIDSELWHMVSVAGIWAVS